MKITTNFLMFFLILNSFVFADFSSARDELLKHEFIALEDDLDGDGLTEIVAHMREINGELKVFFYDGQKYEAAGTEIKIFDNPELTSTRIKYFALDNGPESRRLVLYSNLMKDIEGHSYSAGNAIAMAEYKNRKLDTIFTTYSEYEPHTGPNPTSIEKRENVDYKLGRERFFNIASSTLKDELLFQSDETKFFLDKNFKFQKAEVELPEKAVIYSYKRNSDGFKCIFRGREDVSYKKKFSVWSAEDQRIESFDPDFEGSIADIRFGDLESDFEVKYSRESKWHILKLRKKGKVLETIEDNIVRY